MKLARPKQILVKLQAGGRGASESGTIGASDAMLVYEPSVRNLGDAQERTPASQSLSSQTALLGLETREVAFQSDFRGSGDTTVPGMTAPDWEKTMLASGFRAATVKKVPLTGISGGGYQIGEKVSKDASNWGVALNATSGATADLNVAIVEGDITSTGTLTGASSGTTGTIGTVAAADCNAYRPWSGTLLTIATGAWTGGAPSLAGGQTMGLVTRSGAVVGAIRAVADNSAGAMTNFDAEPVWGVIANGDIVSFAGATKTATLSSTPTVKAGAVATIRANRGGYAQDATDAQGTWSLEGRAGESMVFSWTFTGSKGSHADLLPVSATGVDTATKAPRMLGAIVGIGFGNQFYRMPIKSVTVTPNNQISQDLNANATSGSDGGEIIDRGVEIRLTVNAAGTSFDWQTLKSASSPVRFGLQLGSSTGNIVGLCAPVAQITALEESDSDGIATYDITLRARGQTINGEDEFYIWAR